MCFIYGTILGDFKISNIFVSNWLKQVPRVFLDGGENDDKIVATNGVPSQLHECWLAGKSNACAKTWENRGVKIVATNIIASWLPKRQTNWNADHLCQLTNKKFLTRLSLGIGMTVS